MAFHVELIDNQDDCAVLLEENEHEIKKIEFELASLTRKEEEQALRDDNLQEDIRLAEARVTRLATEASALTVGTAAYNTKQLELETAQVRVKVLKNRASNGSNLSQVERAREQARAQALLQVEQSLKTELNTRKSELAQAPQN